MPPHLTLPLTGEEAEKLEKLLGVAVLRHKYKKPQGNADELENHFGYGPLSEMPSLIPYKPNVSLSKHRSTAYMLDVL